MLTEFYNTQFSKNVILLNNHEIPPKNNEYRKAKEVTQERMYLETMEKVLADIDKVIIDKDSGSGVVPYLPLPELKKKTN